MVKGISIKITRLIETRERRKDEYRICIWTGICLRSLGYLSNSPGRWHARGSEPRVVTTEILYPPPKSLPMTALGYPRVLPPTFWANDNRSKMSPRGRQSANKIIVVEPEASQPAKTTSDATILQHRKSVTADRLEEALLRRLSKQFHRHVFVHSNGRYGYIDETLQFIPVDAG